MANFVGNIEVSNTAVKTGIKGVFNWNGSKLYSTFHKTAVLGNIRVFNGSKTVLFGSTASTIRVTGQLFP